MGRVGRLIQILNLQALASQDQREMEQALPALQRALSLAEPEGYVRTFIDEGEPMARLLRRALGQGIMPSYVGRLLAALGDVTKAKLSSSVLSPGSGQALRPSSPLWILGVEKPSQIFRALERFTIVGLEERSFQ